MTWKAHAAAIVASSAAGQANPPRRPVSRPRVRTRWERLVGEPRNAVWLVLGAVLLLGGGRRLLLAWRARGAVGKLGEAATVTPESIDAVVEHGRAGMMDLFRLLGSAESEPIRRRAGQALAVLWAHDEMIAEEEKALVRRGFQSDWRARKRYPRAIRTEVPVVVRFGVPFLSEEGAGVRPSNLEWSYRVTGAKRASLETPSPWVAGPGVAAFTLVPGDFETDGPHRLVLQARVRTTGLTEAWEMELPHMPFSFEFDPLLAVDSLLALPDASRSEEIGRRVRLSGPSGGGPEAAMFLPLGPSLALRDPPGVAVEWPIPCDLAHAVFIEFEGGPGRFAAGSVVAVSDHARGGSAAGPMRLPIGPVESIPPEVIDRPGPRRMRAVLVADPDRGWSEPDVRSVWPGTIETGWVDVEVVRR